MSGKHAYSWKARDREAAMQRHAAAVETRRYMQGFPQFQPELNLTDQLRDLLGRLEQAEQPRQGKR